jgi:hypothetical protein
MDHQQHRIVAIEAADGDPLFRALDVDGFERLDAFRGADLRRSAIRAVM